MSASEINFRVPHDGLCHEQISVRDHQAARHYAYAPFEYAHIYVEFKEGYTLAIQKGAGKSDDRWVIGAQKLFHITDVRCGRVFVHSTKRDHLDEP